MVFLRAARGWLFLLCCGMLVAGCDPRANSPLDEQKDPHFIRGRAYLGARDYDNAIKSFEAALNGNPNHASAHKELGLVYFQAKKDYARAIYHFKRLLELRPNDDIANLIEEYIIECKRGLATEVTVIPVNRAEQRNLELIEQLKKENGQLKQYVEYYQAHLAAAQRALREAQQTPLINPTVITRTNPPGAIDPIQRQPPETGHLASRLLQANTETPQAPAGRTHTVRSGDSLYSIARKYGIRDYQLVANANPSINPRRLQIGQVLRLPTQ